VKNYEVTMKGVYNSESYVTLPPINLKVALHNNQIIHLIIKKQHTDIEGVMALLASWLHKNLQQIAKMT
jgi:hypothetical protein